MVEAALFDKLEAVARSVCAVKSGFWWFSMWNPSIPALKAFLLLSRAVRQQNKPFGGIQLIICGDFLQLPPVTKGSQPPQFCFQVPLALLLCPPIPRGSALLPDTLTLLLPGQELEEVCPSDPGADQGVEAGRPDLRLFATGRQAGQVGPVNSEGATK